MLFNTKLVSMQISKSNKISVTFILLAQLLILCTAEVLAATVTVEAIKQLSQGNTVDLIVEYDDTLIENCNSENNKGCNNC